METLFSSVLKLSLWAVPVILLALVLRFALKKAPKCYILALWLAVFASLVLPLRVSVKLPQPVESVGYQFSQTELAQAVQQAVVPQTEITFSDTQTVLPPVKTIGFAPKMWHIWLCGIMVLAAFEIVNLKGIYDKTRFAFRKQDNVWLCDGVKMPFVYGIFKPKIILPSDISPADEKYVIQHEQNHIRHRDHITKPLCFVIAVVHWFNPFVWLALHFAAKDMELCCDEQVIKQLDTAQVKEYCACLLNFAVKDKPYRIGTVLFGEGNCSMRIKNILNFKQPKKITAVVLSLCILLAGCTAFATGETNSTVEGTKPNSTNLTESNSENTTGESKRDPEFIFSHDPETEDSLDENNDDAADNAQGPVRDNCYPEKEDEDVCGYPTSEYFEDDKKTDGMTHTGQFADPEDDEKYREFLEDIDSSGVYLDKDTGDVAVIHLPNIVAGSFAKPFDTTDEAIMITRGYTGHYPQHNGIDWTAPYGTEILAAGDGTVVWAEKSTVGYGKYVVIEHYNGFYTLYAHCSELLVSVDDEVKQGEVIAKVGCTGNSTGNHLHFEAMYGRWDAEKESNGEMSTYRFNPADIVG
ncbi:MAG: peptidoglycan DD-metalloendopeptidase family protein [Oscillospiraceae bacterium]|nr:peptidoglycan DD-metalloendopeptidase family protein [Oscillospiraceae bacterium]